MNAQLAFCEHCRDDRLFQIEEKELEAELKGKIHKYNGEIAYCKDCNSEIYVPDVHDRNLRALYDEYRKKTI